MDSSEQITNGMDPVWYRAAAKGDIGPFEKYPTPLNELLTPQKHTILHVFLENQSEEPEVTDFVDKILEMCPPLLQQTNTKGETPLHFAARYGHSNLVKVLVGRAEALPIDPESKVTEAQKMLRMTNGEKDTALHVAARNIKSSVVEILTKKDPEFSYSANDHGETPLYIATNTNKESLSYRNPGDREKSIGEILRNCISVDYGGPNGTTALHAAIMRRDNETARKILEKEKNLTKTTDQKGWSPLHYAAYFQSDDSTVKLLLEYDVSAAYIVDIDKKRTALHIAAIRGNQEAMEEIVSCCPACCELVDNRGWNALHYAVASKNVDVFMEFERIPELKRLKTEKDDQGNTPFHLIAALALEQVKWRRFLCFSYIDEMIFGLNKQNLSIQDIFEGNNVETQQKEILESIEDVGSGMFDSIVMGAEEKASSKKRKALELLDKGRDAHLVVAALIATVTFAAAFTLPGGYKNEQGPHQGTAVLAKKAAFIVFVISDAIAMVLSISAVFIHFWMVLLQFWKALTGDFDYDGTEDEAEDDTIRSYRLFGLASLLTILAMITMVIAFITGTYVVLTTSLGLAITTCFIGLSFFLSVYIVYRVMMMD